jgi:hypothetical protein
MDVQYNLPPDKLLDAIHNTIRVFKHYSILKRTNRDGRSIIMDASWFGRFYFYIIETEGGSQLSIEAGKTIGKNISPEELESHEKTFIKNIEKIIDKEIVITPEIANTDIYKDKQKASGLTSLILLISALIMVFVGFKACMATY